MQRWVVLVAVGAVAVGCGEMEEDDELARFPSVQTVGEGEVAVTGGLDVAADGLGTTASFSTNHFNAGMTKAFFSALGTNRRSCNSCHLKDQGWTIAAARVRALAPDDPIFEPVDGSDCPPDRAEQGPDASRSTLLTAHGVIRIQLSVPDGADFSLERATNPQGCAIAPASPAAGGALFLFRRPLPTANLEFVSSVMWDGRETLQPLTQRAQLAGTSPLRFDLAHQDNTATLGHERADSALRMPATGDLLGFETRLYVAQLTRGVLRLDAKGAHGGPQYLGEVIAPSFFVGENDPAGTSFDREVFRLFKAWEPGVDGHPRPHLSDAEKAIGRGERIFNTKTFSITGVAGLNSAKDDARANPQDPLLDRPVPGTCSTCHNAFDVGDHSTPLFLDIGISGVGGAASAILATADLPVYTLRSTAIGQVTDAGPALVQTTDSRPALVQTTDSGRALVQVTDPGRGLVTGRFVDLGKTKVPVLRGLPARAPYFHNGSAPDLATLVRFYDARFQIGLTDEEASDLVAFLGAL